MSNNEVVHERWLPVPGYEGLYEVSDQGRLCRQCDSLRNKAEYAANREKHSAANRRAYLKRKEAALRAAKSGAES